MWRANNNDNGGDDDRANDDNHIMPDDENDGDDIRGSNDNGDDDWNKRNKIAAWGVTWPAIMSVSRTLHQDLATPHASSSPPGSGLVLNIILILLFLPIFFPPFPFRAALKEEFG